MAGHLHACFAQTGCKYELKDAKKDKEDARHHPQVEAGHVRHPGHNQHQILVVSCCQIHCTIKVLLHAYLGTFCLTLPNIAVTVSNVVIPMETLPGTDSTDMKRESQARLTKTMEGKKVR